MYFPHVIQCSLCVGDVSLVKCRIGKLFIMAETSDGSFQLMQFVVFSRMQLLSHYNAFLRLSVLALFLNLFSLRKNLGDLLRSFMLFRSG